MNNLLTYLEKTSTVRQGSNLFISFVKPYKQVSRDTNSRWCKNVLNKSGITSDMFTPHSSRSAASSKSKLSGIPITDILKNAGWSTEKTFALCYEKVVVDDVHILKQLLKE